jgi:Uma2 family endonuclease
MRLTIMRRAHLHFNRRAEQTTRMPTDTKVWSVEEVREMQDESRPWPRFELIDGELLVTPAPEKIHQIGVGEVFLQLAVYVDRERVGVTLLSPSDLELHPGTIAQPDVFVVPVATGVKGATSKPRRGWASVTSLLLAVEVISPSSVRTDRHKKREYYLGAGVPDYWVIDFDARILERWTPGSESPVMLQETFEWRPAGASTPLVVNLPELFENAWRKYRLFTGE